MAESTYTVYRQLEFAAAHFLREYHGECENLHGHNYIVRIYVSASGSPCRPRQTALYFDWLRYWIRPA